MGAAGTWQEHSWVAAGRGTVRAGVGVTSVAPEAAGAARLRLAEAVDALGLDSLWVPDHPTVTTDCWTTLAAFAAATKRVRLGPLVSCVFYRTPFQLARAAADVDQLSGGRLILGLGTGSYLVELGPMGLPLPGNADRRRRMRDTLRALRRLWRGEPFRPNFAERSLEGAALRYAPVQRPRVPLLIAGGGERVTLRWVARHADMCNLESRDAEELRRKLDVLRAHCDAVGRPYESIVRSHLRSRVVLAPTERAAEAKAAALALVRVGGAPVRPWTPQEMVAAYAPLIRAGLQYVIVNLTEYDDLETVELLAQRVVPELRALAG
jgi:alkanesulfonate monooxygenase SsuD/methylene tetrahydromethanopterin reductase-like flavin-dependent oxidoreductase (luciferase family)